jgi:hypothetical protein
MQDGIQRYRRLGVMAAFAIGGLTLVGTVALAARDGDGGRLMGYENSRSMILVPVPR